MADDNWGAYGEASRPAILTEEQVREIKRLLGRVSQRELAARYGVKVSTISDIATGRTWSRVRREQPHDSD